MDAPEIKKESSFWQSNRDAIISIVIILFIMFALNYLFKIALHSKFG